MDHEEIKERRFPYSTACTLTLVNSPQGGKTYDESRGIRHEAGSEKFRPLARSNPEGLGGHAHFAWNGASF